MKKRIRKKLKLDEFKETGFEITWKPQDHLSEADLDKFLQEFLESVESRGLVFGGGCSTEDSWEGIVIRNKRYSCPDAADKEFISDWFKNRTDVKEYSVGQDFDLWYESECCCDAEA
jgi:uncharacterized protein YggL (DUF469 family)